MKNRRLMSEHSYPKREVKTQSNERKTKFRNRRQAHFQSVEKYSFSKVKNMYFIRQPTVCVLIKTRFSSGENSNLIGIAHFTFIDTTRTLLCRNYVIKWEIT